MFQLTDGEDLWQFSTYDSAFDLVHDVFIGILNLISLLGNLFPGMGSFIFNILFTLLFSMGPLLPPLRHFKCEVDEAST